jgi:hypothetical protein
MKVDNNRVRIAPRSTLEKLIVDVAVWSDLYISVSPSFPTLR